jgi:DNA-binding GntR family transcriptional regulator
MTLSPLEPSTPGTGNGTGANQAYARLREAILHGQLAPGRVVSQVQLARELGVSRTPLREAVRMLQREGLISGEANRMVRVAEFSIEDVEELYAVRIANEARAIRLTVPLMTAEDDAELERSLDAMARYATEGDIDAWELRHRAFHAQLVGRAGQRLGRLLSELYDHAERYRRLYVTSEPRAMSIGAAEHEAIVEACRARDADQAGAELARHLSRTALMALMQIAPEHEPAMVRSTLKLVLAPPAGVAAIPRLREEAV